MRALIVASLVALPAFAAAAPRSIVWNDRVVDNRANPSEPQRLTNVSHTLYINNCLPDGCNVGVGRDSSLTDRSSIPDSPAHLDAWGYGDDHWNLLVECVKDTFRPFDITVVTDNPGQASHHEVMVAGYAGQLRQGMEAGGVAPFIGCGATEDNGLSFVFASQSGSIDYLCAAVVQEAAHVWGLDHELDADDPMTYLDLGSSKRFQNSDPQCGEELSNPRRCRCGGNTQNSFEYMRNTFGLNPNIGPASLTLAKPTDGRWVGPEFPISAALDSDLSMLRGQLAIDGDVIEQWQGTDFLAWNAPATLAPGPHTITVTVTDTGDRTVTATATVKVAQSCASGCPSDFSCIDDLCVPGADEPGGLGSACSGNEECVTSKCTSDGTTSLCTASCGSDGTCPSGFECIAEVSTCWPESSGGCKSSGNAAPAFLLIVLGGLFLTRRRR